MDYLFLSKTLLFRETTPNEVEKMLDCLQGEVRQFSKGQTVCRAGEPVQSLGLVLSGGVHIENDDLWGNKSILGHAAPGQVFAETYACIPGEPLMVNAVASQTTEILFLNITRFLEVCPAACPCHSKLIRNLLAVMAQKNLTLSRRAFHTSSKSIRGRLLYYLSFQAARQGSYQVSIPFNRQQLADYLSVDRSALSNELSKMRRDGLLTVEKSIFVLREKGREE